MNEYQNCIDTYSDLCDEIRRENLEGEKRQYSMHTSLFLYVGNFILFCKLCHYIM